MKLCLKYSRLFFSGHGVYCVNTVLGTSMDRRTHAWTYRQTKWKCYISSHTMLGAAIKTIISKLTRTWSSITSALGKIYLTNGVCIINTTHVGWTAIKYSRTYYINISNILHTGSTMTCMKQVLLKQLNRKTRKTHLKHLLVAWWFLSFLHIGIITFWPWCSAICSHSTAFIWLCIFYTFHDSSLFLSCRTGFPRFWAAGWVFSATVWSRAHRTWSPSPIHSLRLLPPSIGVLATNW